MRVVAADIGGTHARFALAEVENGKVLRLGEAVTLKTASYASLATAWQAFAARMGAILPRAAGIAVAAPIGGETLKLTNNPWVIRPATLESELGLDRVTLVNDFGAVAHAVAQFGSGELRHLCGPDRDLPDPGVTSILGPGTGLGVALILRREGRHHVMESEGGHIDFAPVDMLEDAILARLRQRYHRVSVERIVSGPGLVNLYEALGAIEGRPIHMGDDASLWARAIAGEEPLSAAALARFCLSFGSVAGDLALAHGAGGVVLAGGIAPRIADYLPLSGFAGRFAAKGRFERMMAAIPVKLVTHPQPGLYGAAAAFAQEHLI